MILTIPPADSKEAGRTAATDVGETKVVGRAVPLAETVDADVKLLPEMDSGVPAEPIGADWGERRPIDGIP